MQLDPQAPLSAQPAPSSFNTGHIYLCIVWLPASLPWYWHGSLTITQIPLIQLVPSTYILNIPNSRFFPYTLPNNPNSRTLNLQKIPFPLTIFPYCSPQILPLHTSSYNHWSRNQVFFRAIQSSISHHCLCDSTSYLIFTCKGSNLTSSREEEYFFFWLKFTSARNACCSWTILNLLYPDDLTWISFRITFSNQRLLMFKSILMLDSCLFLWSLFSSFWYDNCQLVTKSLKKNCNGTKDTPILAGILHPPFPQTNQTLNRGTGMRSFILSACLHRVNLLLTFVSLSLGATLCFTLQSLGSSNHGYLNSWPLFQQPPDTDSPAQY